MALAAAKASERESMGAWWLAWATKRRSDLGSACGLELVSAKQSVLE